MYEETPGEKMTNATTIYLPLGNTENSSQKRRLLLLPSFVAIFCKTDIEAVHSFQFDSTYLATSKYVSALRAILIGNT